MKTIQEKQITTYLERLQQSSNPASVVTEELRRLGFEVTEFANGTIFALLLGDMPSKEGSVFGADLHSFPAVAELLAMSEVITQPREYKHRLHHPDLELVFFNGYEEDAAPDFMKIYAPNAYLLEEEEALGTTIFAADPLVEDRYHTVVEGLGHSYRDSGLAQSDLNRLFASKQIRTISVSPGNTKEAYRDHGDILLFLAVAYQE